MNIALTEKLGHRMTEALKELTDIDVEQRYRDMLDEIYPAVKIGYSSYMPSEIVEKLSPTDFRCGVADYISSEDALVEIDGKYYDADDIERLAERVADEEEARKQIEKEIEEVKK